METGQVKIILADNRASNRRGLRAILAFEPRISIIGEASGGVEAVQLVEKLQPDVLLMDIHMPDMDGLKATKLIKSSWPAVKIILYSVYPGYQEEAKHAGADIFLVKGSSEATPADVILSLFPEKV